MAGCLRRHIAAVSRRPPHEMRVNREGIAKKMYAILRGAPADRRWRAEAVLRRRCDRWTSEAEKAVDGILASGASEAAQEVITSVGGASSCPVECCFLGCAHRWCEDFASGLGAAMWVRTDLSLSGDVRSSR